MRKPPVYPVGEAYGLTPEEVGLMSATATPRMPIGAPTC